MLKLYCNAHYHKHKKAFHELRLEYATLDHTDPLLNNKTYTVSVEGDEPELIKNIQEMASTLKNYAKMEELSSSDNSLHAYFIDSHLYAPLLYPNTEKISITPCALNKSEMNFVTELEKWYAKNGQASPYIDYNLYLLRNLTRGKGIGFFEAGGFYPDFLLWWIRKEDTKTDNTKDYLTFIEPHGLLQGGQGFNSPKVQFAKDIKNIERRLGEGIVLNSFILYPDEKKKLKGWSDSQKVFDDNHILFMEQIGADCHYLDTMMRRVLPSCLFTEMNKNE